MFENARRLTDTVGGDVVAAGGKAVPPIAVTGLSAGGVSLQDWVYILTLVYLVLQIAYLVWKFWRRSRNAGDE